MNAETHGGERDKEAAEDRIAAIRSRLYMDRCD